MGSVRRCGGPDVHGGAHEVKRSATVLTRTVVGLAAVLLPVVTLMTVYLLIAGLTTRTESADRSLGLVGYFGFAAAGVVICALVGVAGSAFSRSPGAIRVCVAGGWIILGASILLLLALSFTPSAPPWASWRSFRSFISLLGTPFVFAIAMTSYTVGFGVRLPRRRWLAVVVLSVLPGLMIAAYGLLDPMS